MKPIVVAAIVGVSVVVVVAVVVPCVLLLPASSAEDNRVPFEFNDLWTSTYNPSSIYPSWDESTPGDQLDFITKDSNDQIWRRRIDKPYDNFESIAPGTPYGEKSSNGYFVSADALFVLYRSNYTKVWRHSYTAQYHIYDVTAGTFINILDFPADAGIQYVAWSPTGHKLAYVHNFNVKMIQDVGEATPVIVDVSPTDGLRNMKYYGIPDWMYEEEMISTNNVLYWSPDSTKIAFLETDETGVNLIKYTWYGDGQYPQTIEIAYPKAGSNIGKVKLWVYDTIQPNYTTNVELAAPAEFIGSDYYYSRFTWKNSTTCLVSWTNRFQTHSIAQLCVQSETDYTFSCGHNNANEEVVNNGWVGSFGPFYPLWKTSSNEHDYFTIYARAGTDTVDGFWQIAYVKESVATRTWITNTGFDIVELNYYDAANDYIYFTAIWQEARNRQIFRVKSSARNSASPECMTCDLEKTTYPDRCGWISPVFNLDGSGVVINCRGHLMPLTLWMPIGTDGSWGKMLEIQMNQDIQTKVDGVLWPVREFGKFQSTKYPSKPYNYEIWRPANFDPAKKYPLLIEVYAGPEFQKVTATWRKGFAQTYMVSGRDVIVASVDGRGSAFEGYKFMREAYLKLGQNEPIDQTDFANYLINTYDYIDANHVALWGWSYGGYTTSHTLGYDAGNTFQCGVAVAPLGDWRWYDAMYAERYMGNVTANQDGYSKASIIEGHDLNNFKNSWYVLIHGTADDNVHFQSAAEMEKALVAADVDFDDFFYADQAHSINVGNANKHIYRQIDHRLSYCLGKYDTPYPG